MDSLRRLIPPASPRAWMVLAGDAVAHAGFGLVFPFLVIYLHQGRGLSLSFAGLCLGVLALGDFAAGPFAGAIADRVGARRVLIASVLITGASTAALALVGTAWQALVVSLLIGLGAAGVHPSMNAVLATSVTAPRRSNVFALEHALGNAGFGAGAIIGGLAGDVSHPRTFVVLFVGAGFALGAWALLLVRMGEEPVAAPNQHETAAGPPGLAPGESAAAEGAVAEGAEAVGNSSAATAREPVAKTGYRAVAADRVLLRVLMIVALLVAVSGSQLDAAFPMYATTTAGVGTRVIGIAFAANTLTVVILQLVVLHKLRGRRRTRALMITCLLSAACWLLTLLAGHVGGGTPAAVTLVLALVMVGVGETFWSPSTPGIVNDLAPDRLRARYNAMLGFADAGGALIGPPVAGLVIGAGLGGGFLVAIAVACVLIIPAVRNLERVLPIAANIVGGEEAILRSAASEPLSPTL